MAMKAIQLAPSDTVATVLDETPAGAEVEVVRQGVHVRTLTATEQVPFGFKIAVETMAAGAPVIKYGHRIGIASKDIAEGELVHVHNIEGARGRGDLAD